MSPKPGRALRRHLELMRDDGPEAARARAANRVAGEQAQREANEQLGQPTTAEEAKAWLAFVERRRGELLAAKEPGPAEDGSAGPVRAAGAGGPTPAS